MDEAVHAAEIDECTERHHRRHHTLANLAGLEVIEEFIAGLALGLLEVATAGQHHVVAVLVELDDLGLEHLAHVGLQVTHAAQFHERCGEESTQTDVDDEATLHHLDDESFDHAIGFLDLLDGAPRTLVLRTLLGENQTTLFVLLGEDQCFHLLAQLDDLVGVHVVADRELTARDHALGLVSDIEQDLVLVDLHNGASDELAVLDVDERSVDGVCERGAEVIGGDLAGGVVAFLVE